MSAPAAKTVTRTPFKKWCDENVGLLFLIPWIIGFVVFKLYPFATSLFYSFTDMNFFDGITKYGLMNYIYIFTNKKTLTSFIITFRYALITVPLKLIFALFIAYILNFKIKCVNLFRTIYYIPSILGGSVAIAVLWKALFKEDGIINILLSFIGIQGPSWLADPDYAMVVIIVLRVWQFGSAMVLFLAALKGVSVDLYEAATIDGASRTRQFFSITVPMITPLSSTTSLPRLLRRSRNSTVPTLSLIMAAPRFRHAGFAAGLQLCVQEQRNGYGLRHGLGHVHHHRPAHCHRIWQPEALGLLC